MTDDAQLPEATDKLRAGLLLHGSTSDDNYQAVTQLHWASSLDEAGEVWRQGIATKEGDVFLSDMVEHLMEMPGLDEYLRREFPQLTSQSIQASVHALWLVISSVQMFTQLLSVEGELDDLDKKVLSMNRHLQYYLNKNE